MNFQTLLDNILPDPVQSRDLAAKLREEHPNLSPAELARHAIRSAKVKAALAGAATGVASSPLTMIPAALADMATVLKIEGSLVGVVAALMQTPGARQSQPDPARTWWAWSSPPPPARRCAKSASAPANGFHKPPCANTPLKTFCARSSAWPRVTSANN